MATRLCKRCGEPALSQRHWYCGPCRDQAAEEYHIKNRERGRKYDTPEKRRERWRRESENGRPSATARGYGPEHKRLREQWKKRIEGGETVFCNRCQNQIMPGSKWHLDHDDEDRSVYRGPAHEYCNLSPNGGRVSREKIERWREKREQYAQVGAERRRRIYGKEHRAARKEWARKVAEGGVVCVRCLDPILVDDDWDLGHDDLFEDIIVGPEHRGRCNRSAGGKKAAGTLVATSTNSWSRDWLPAA